MGKQYAGSSALQIIINVCKKLFATKQGIDELTTKIAYLDPEDDETITEESPSVNIESAIKIEEASVGQTIVVKEVDANGKPTAWESADYQPRTHWEEECVIIPETIIEPDPDTMECVFETSVSPTIGDSYKVMWNGTEYNSICTGFDMDGYAVPAIGNVGAMMEEEGTGEPFVLFFVSPESICTVVALDGSTTVTLSIIGNVATPIPKKYLSNAIPYYIDIMGSGTTDDPFRCNSDAETFERALDSGRVIMLRIVVFEDPNGTGGTRTYYYLQYTSTIYSLETEKEMHQFYNPVIGAKIVYLVPQEDGTLAVEVV